MRGRMPNVFGVSGCVLLAWTSFTNLNNKRKDLTEKKIYNETFR